MKSATGRHERLSTLMPAGVDEDRVEPVHPDELQHRLVAQDQTDYDSHATVIPTPLGHCVRFAHHAMSHFEALWPDQAIYARQTGV
jgi:hypothetical protein